MRGDIVPVDPLKEGPWNDPQGDSSRSDQRAALYTSAPLADNRKKRVSGTQT